MRGTTHACAPSSWTTRALSKTPRALRPLTVKSTFLKPCIAITNAIRALQDRVKALEDENLSLKGGQRPDELELKRHIKILCSQIGQMELEKRQIVETFKTERL